MEIPPSTTSSTDTSSIFEIVEFGPGAGALDGTVSLCTLVFVAFGRFSWIEPLGSAETVTVTIQTQTGPG